MDNFNISIQDIYEKNSQKNITVRALNSQLAHKEGLKSTNALREEIAIIRDGKKNIVFTYKDGFKSSDE